MAERGAYWRVGTSPATHGRTIYRHTDDGPDRGELVGVMFTGDDAATVVEAVNRQLELERAGDAPSEPAGELEREGRGWDRELLVGLAESLDRFPDDQPDPGCRSATGDQLRALIADRDDLAAAHRAAEVSADWWQAQAVRLRAERDHHRRTVESFDQGWKQTIEAHRRMEERAVRLEQERDAARAAGATWRREAVSNADLHSDAANVSKPPEATNLRWDRTTIDALAVAMRQEQHPVYPQPGTADQLRALLADRDWHREAWLAARSDGDGQAVARLTLRRERDEARAEAAQLRAQLAVADRDRPEVVDPHHAIRADGITVAVVPCDDTCPQEHFQRRTTDKPAEEE